MNLLFFLTMNELKEFDNISEFIDELIQIDHSFFPYPWSEKSWIEIINDSTYTTFILFHKRKLIGFSLWRLNSIENLAHLLKIVIDPRFRGRGDGERLLLFSIKSLHEKFEKFYLEVEVDNFSAIKCYEKINFKRLHRVRRFYSNGTDAYIYLLASKVTTCKSN